MLLDHSITELSQLLQKKEASSKELVEETFSHISQLEPQLHNFLTLVDKERAISAATRADEDRQESSSQLHGIPFGLKDCYITQDIRTTAGSKILENFVPPFNATVYEKLQHAGAILIGKQTMDAWGHGGSNENSDFEVPHNPWNLEHTTGGSSGGSAGSVAAREVAFSIGEDTGGSIRNPASMCNISGLKVTYGRVSRFGAIAYASSLDTVGPMAKYVSDLAIILNHIAGGDAKDASSSSQPVDNYVNQLSQSLKGKVIGLPKEFFGQGTDPEVKSIILTAVKKFEEFGATIQEISIPILEASIPIYYMIAASETSSNLARYNGVRFGTDRSQFTDENNRRIILGTYALSAGYADELYKKAQKARTELIHQFNQAFENVDVLMGPVTPMTVPKIGELIGDPLQNMLSDLFTVSVNITGVPALSIPAGFSGNNLPVGLQIIGKKFHEGQILAFGHQYQQVTDWHTRKPEII